MSSMYAHSTRIPAMSDRCCVMLSTVTSSPIFLSFRAVEDGFFSLLSINSIGFLRYRTVMSLESTSSLVRISKIAQ